ncbi:hypothetical protein [Bacillus infantis]|uniref:hypothetical protein n=1 Tax=Bacillus infantis TaxID=324767 RepID=UPI003CF7DF89
MPDKIFYYISNRFDEDGVLVDADEIYEAFAVEFDNGVSLDLVDEVMEGFIRCHDLTGIEIQYEGEIEIGLQKLYA